MKIEPKAIGVGQYQHDVSQTRLAQMLNAVVEDCVNAVGVDVNMASVPLLTQVSGLSTAMAENIVSHRYDNLLPTFFITNMNLDQFKAHIGDRLADRLRDNNVVRFTLLGESLRGK